MFDASSTIIINGKTYPFNDILDFEVESVSQGGQIYATKTSTGRMVGRGIVGCLLLGGVGAIAPLLLTIRQSLHLPISLNTTFTFI